MHARTLARTELTGPNLCLQASVAWSSLLRAPVVAIVDGHYYCDNHVDGK